MGTEDHSRELRNQKREPHPAWRFHSPPTFPIVPGSLNPATISQTKPGKRVNRIR